MKICEECGSEITGYGKRFCSLKCANKHNAVRGPRTDKVKYCINPECGEKFWASDSRRKYCSKSCAARVNNLGVVRNGSASINCLRCGNRTGSSIRKYCSLECLKLHPIEQWLRGERSAQNSYTLASWARNYILERAGYQCEAIDSRTGERCIENRFKPGGTTVLQIDHKDGNWQNDHPDNLRALCPTCHCLTENYGAANMGNGRTWKKNYNQFSPKQKEVEGPVKSASEKS